MLTNTKLRIFLIITTALCVLSPGARAQQAQPPVKSPAMQSADALFEGKKWAEAAKAYDEVTKAEPTNAQAWFNYGMSLYSSDKFADAAAAFNRASELVKAGQLRRLSLYNTAASYARAGDKAKALDSLDRITAANPLLGIGVEADTDFASLKSEPRFKEFTVGVERAQKPCMFEAGYRQFDFFMGDWDVFVQGRKIGESHTKVLQQGCIIEENWVTQFQTGQSFNFYNPVTKKWHQSYMDSNGGNYMMDGEYKDGALRYEGFIYSPAGQVPVRMTFYNLEPGKLRQTSETSADGGKTWVQGWDGLYVRKGSDAGNK
ncbi:MAG: tetratricopeptide repeat protein [Pyrinomonadaceae bacterium]